MLTPTDVNVWHKMLAHLNIESLNSLKKGINTNVNFLNSNIDFCEGCIFRKQKKNVFENNHKRASRTLELIHIDVCQILLNTVTGERYFITFIDDYSKMIFIYLIKTKDQVTQLIKQFIPFV